MEPTRLWCELPSGKTAPVSGFGNPILFTGSHVTPSLLFPPSYPKKASSASEPRRLLGSFLPSLEHQIPLEPALHCSREHTRWAPIPSVQLTITTQRAICKTLMPWSYSYTLLLDYDWFGDNQWAVCKHYELRKCTQIHGLFLSDITKCLWCKKKRKDGIHNYNSAIVQYLSQARTCSYF